MTYLRLLRRWWLNRVPPPHARLVLVLGMAIRASGVLMLALTLPAIWGHMTHPWWSALLALCLAAENATVALWWLRQRRPDPRVLWLDLPAGVAAIVIGTWLAPRHGVQSWTLFVFPNTVLLSFVSGMLCRGAGAAATCGALWAGTYIAATLALRDGPVGAATQPAVGYLVNSLIGWRGGSMLRGNEQRLAAALAAEVGRQSELAAAAQRWALATALHDGVLQTLETLHRSSEPGGQLVDPALRAEVAHRAAWLRRYIETGCDDPGERSLAADLDAVAAAARRAGVAVEVNAARLLAAQELFDGTSRAPAERLLADPQHDALVAALFQAIKGFGPHRDVDTDTSTDTDSDSDSMIMVRAVPDRGGVFITVLSTADVVPDPEALADADTLVASVGGRLEVAAGPCVEMWVPGADAAGISAPEPEAHEPADTGRG
ncbi:MAG: hypothetical protein HOV87_34195 [Catenulispora sp.]|nr:hypothetical protein [Catenulispora sp.]